MSHTAVAHLNCIQRPVWVGNAWQLGRFCLSRIADKIRKVRCAESDLHGTRQNCQVSGKTDFCVRSLTHLAGAERLAVVQAQCSEWQERAHTSKFLRRSQWLLLCLTAEAFLISSIALGCARTP